MARGWIPKTIDSTILQVEKDKENLDNWDPMREDYNCPVYNSHKPMEIVDVIRRYHDQPKLSSNSIVIEGIQLYVTNIPHKFVNKKQLREMFETVGEVTNFKLITSNPDLPYSYGFVTYKTEIDAITAVKRFNGKILDPSQKLKPLFVSLSSGSKNHNSSSNDHTMKAIRNEQEMKNSNSNIIEKCEACGKCEIKFRCNKCNSVCYCSGACLAKDELAHESICQSKQSTQYCNKAVSLLENGNTQLESPTFNKQFKTFITDKMDKDPKHVSLSNFKEVDPISSPSVSNCPNASTKKFHSVPSGEIADLVVTHIEKVNKFYCVLNSSIAEERLRDFNDFLNSVPLEPINGSPKIGSLVVAPFEGCLYRAVIVRKLSHLSESTVIVLFVDFGNKQEVSFFDLKTCQHELFQTFPYQAIECRFNCLKEFESFSDNKALLEGCEFKAKILYHDGRTHVITTDLQLLSYLPATINEKAVSVVDNTSTKIMIANNHQSAVSFSNTTPKPSNDTLSMNTNFQVPKHSTNASGMTVYGDHYVKPSLKLIPGKQYRFVVTNINGNNFYINLADNFSKLLSSAVNKHIISENLKNLLPISNIDDINRDKLKLNSALCIYTTDDGIMHRGRVLYSIEDGSCLVFDIDNGNKNVVPIENLYEMSELYLQISELAILCTGDQQCIDTAKSLYTLKQESMLNVLSVERSSVIKYTVDIIPNTISNSSIKYSIESNKSFSNSSAITPLVNPLENFSNNTARTDDLINLNGDQEITRYCNTFQFDVVEHPVCESAPLTIPSRHVTLGSEFEALVSHFNNENDFYIHLLESGCTSDLSSISARLSLNSPLSFEKIPLIFTNDCTVIPAGAPIIAYDDEDSLYYRCELLSDISKSDTNFTVKAIDFGKMFSATLNKCYSMSHLLAVYPKVAINCSLDKNAEENYTSNVDMGCILNRESETLFSFFFKELLPSGKYLVQLNGVGSNSIRKHT